MYFCRTARNLIRSTQQRVRWKLKTALELSYNTKEFYFITLCIAVKILLLVLYVLFYTKAFISLNIKLSYVKYIVEYIYTSI